MPPPTLTSPPRAKQPWRWLLTNLLVLPGWGSIKGGRIRSGVWQLVLGLIGLVVTTGAFLKIGLEWVHSFQEERGMDLDDRLIWVACVGFVVFFVSWFWGLATGLQLVREYSKKTPGKGTS